MLSQKERMGQEQREGLAAMEELGCSPSCPSELPTDVRITNDILLGQDSGFGEFWWDRKTESWGTTGPFPRSSPYLRE